MAASDDILVGSMAAEAGKNFRTDNVSIAMVVRHIGFRLGYTHLVIQKSAELMGRG
ncbi:hypothetical protein R69658_07830 [Paraburkholderia aspalathi]|uniref:Uncharacterized protein n=1 Tax=Paraburkholderia aspalathi TaxID=1324617 RepID=A0ABN7NB27_9BURK|nr:hypothetical protein [Paraburkholderia aspalathi]MBK3824100.1 hypothetical protein [Paraburkholderia aspalathi]MBK3835938.1 hypothetical protein [Paraburkholderia aspalathi]MBK3865720.1 hypothetical protein [Paraburkholderia aspalathi]CAE6865388.1 hypothetical protein R69658_07830 [Paraburkholderia aspalathi]